MTEHKHMAHEPFLRIARRDGMHPVASWALRGAGLIVSFLVSSIVYTVGQFVWPVAIWVVVAVAAFVGIILYNKHADKKEKEAKLLEKKTLN